MTRRRSACLLFALVVGAAPAVAQLSGTVFEDRDGDGIRDAGEPGLDGVQVRLFGSGVDQTQPTVGDGSFAFSPGNGCYLLSPADPPGWRPSLSRADGFPESTPGYLAPVGQPRFSKFDGLAEGLDQGSLRYTAMGDSIAWNFNFCSYPESFWYHKQFRSRLLCANPSASIALDQAAQKGEHSDDLLVDDNNDLNNVFRALELQPDLITISMIGNDLLDVDPGSNPTQAQANRAVAEVLDARQNLQEVLSTFVSELPQADIGLNTLYDNEAYNCYSGNAGTFHRQWVPIVDRMLRDLAWGQARRVTTIEVAADFAQEDQAGGCTGYDQLICRDIFQFDQIHPTNPGYEVVREKLWESAGGATLGSGDALGRTAIPGADYGYLRHVRRLLPTTWETRAGGAASTPEAAFDDSDGGAAASITLGSDSEEFRLSGFPDYYDEVQIVRVIAGVRYRTTGSVADDFYRIEASIDDRFRPPPGHAYVPTDWNFFTPIVGGGGPNQPAENPDYPNARVLAVPDVAVDRSVSATLTKNPVLAPGAADYSWPPITHEELATTTIRVATAAVAGTSGNDGYQIELDAAWLDLYGWETARPPQVERLVVGRSAAGALELTFDAVAGALRYNVYAGWLAGLAGGYDHGAGAPAGPFCDASTEPAGAGRLGVELSPGSAGGEDLYLLVTAHVDDVESPAGSDSAGTEIDRSQSICR